MKLNPSLVMAKKKKRSLKYKQYQTNVSIVWTKSRSVDYYGQNICSCWVAGKKASSAYGGGYDLIAAALGDWIAEDFEEELLQLAPRAQTINRYSKENEFLVKWGDIEPPKRADNFVRGLTARYCPEEKVFKDVDIDHGRGLNIVLEVFNAIGCELEEVSRTGDSVIDFIYTPSPQLTKSPGNPLLQRSGATAKLLAERSKEGMKGRAV